MRYAALLRNLGRSARRLPSATSGAAAVEFALVSLPFLMLLAGIIQWGFIIWARMNLDFVVESAARNLFTGSFQTNNAGITNTTTLINNLKTVICGSGTNTTPTVFTCSNLKINVSPASNFASGSYANPYDSTTKAISTSFESYTCAKPGQIVVVTAAVSIPVFFGKLLPSLTAMADGSYLMRSTNVFKAEPYSTQGNGAC